ncbi:GGDEF domain-containing protein [Alteromonas lipolytica]|uniref:diguanylate cyclase n=1 Tax=Alteromonas lipolytica TaxID=1856405 RepID=A0A1E8FH04_9ALTE|nr:GGDEF domain-containing protein [Alteromonas lipolytica]OFI34743.1 hypothetical protein BFC17_14280 [Alteromonas lipolytica]GGF53648.1 diguanylate cyclase [Alteromonas lipolytica]
MVQATTTQNTHNILEHISGLTAQKDFELLNFSLLKSLSALLTKTRVQTLAVTQDCRFVKQVKYTSDGLDINSNDIDLDERVTKAITKVHQAELDNYIERIGHQSLAIYVLTQERTVTYYLLVAFPRAITQADSYLIAGVLEIYRNFSSLLAHSQTDELTGLSNRKTFESAIYRVCELIREHVSESEDATAQENDGYWLCAIDIDHFKSVNDQFGHLFGDEVLVRFAQIMRTEFKIDDLLFRFGGEEFIALVKAQDRQAVEVILERFRQTIEDTQFSKIDRLTISLGVVAVDPNVFHMTLMDYADQALYYSKENGRNRMTFFDDLVAQGHARLETFEEGEIDLF